MMAIHNHPENHLEKDFIQQLIKDQLLVSIYLKSGIQLKGHLVGQDESTLILSQQGSEKMIYKPAIATIMLIQSSSLEQPR
jgi:host factor-I protein